ncbi:Josephin-1, partial [Mycoemilia scoparia]
LQREQFTRQDLDQIADDLRVEAALINSIESGSGGFKSWLSSWTPSIIHPHRSYFGLGNWDVNVITRALKQIGYDVAWHDMRNSPSTIDLDNENVLGLIINYENTNLYYGRPHWIAIRQLPAKVKSRNGKKTVKKLYWNLDSEIGQPEVIGNRDQ